MQRIIGLDLGVASIGWSLVEYDGNNQGKIVDTGSRIFDQNLQRDNEAQKGESKSAQRRIHRGMRRLRDRKRRRKRGLYYALKDNGMCPVKKDKEKWKVWIDLNPYELRAMGLDEKLSLEEFGRVLYHLNQRRGFKSNRKSGNDKDGDVKKEISKVRDEMKKTGARSLGEYLFKIQDNHFNPPVAPDHDEYEFRRRIRNKYTHRAMYEEEFDLLWNKQVGFYSEILTKSLRDRISDETIFKQRPMKSQAHLIGKCSLEPDKKRIPKAHLLFQEFRILKTLNNLELADELGRPIVLSDTHKKIIWEKLYKKDSVSFKDIKKALGLNGNAKFNLESSENDKIKGNTTNKYLAQQKAFGKEWYTLDKDFKNHVVDVLIYVEKPEVVKELALNKWGRTEEQAEYLKMLQLEKSYGSLSHKAINKLLPLIKEGKRENEAIKVIYGNGVKPPKADVFQLPLLNQDDYRNPVVFGALVELRKVINAIVRKYGMPDIIRVELARDLKNSRKLRTEITRKNNQLEKKNKEAIKALQQEPFSNQQPSRTDIIKYNLWKECKEVCPYTGRPISPQALANGEFEIEHILPFSRTLDDSFANKTLCESDFNRRKGNRTPWECVEGGLISEDDLQHRIKTLPWKKRRKFMQKTIDTDEFIARQLNDTRYMSREASKYLKQLGTEEWPVDVQVTKGQTTSLLRHLWGLNGILNQDDEDIKNRDDHRHHAVDAVVIALTSRSILKKLSDENKYLNAYEHLEEDEAGIARSRDLKERFQSDDQYKNRITLTYPWLTFWKDARDSINEIIVSHRVSRKISGALHEETYYGPTGESASKKKHIEYLVVRKPVHSLSEKEIGWNKKSQSFDKNEKVFIRDDRIRSIVQDKVWEKFKQTGDISKAIAALESDPPKLLYKKGTDFNPIHRVRVMMEKDLSKMSEFEDVPKTPTRYALYGNNHHIAIYEYTDKKGVKKQTGEVIPAMEAARRVKDREPIIMREHPDYDRFLFSLSPNEMVQDKEGNIYRVQKISSDSQMTFRLHNIALKGAGDPGVLRKNPSSLTDLKKIRIDPIGQIFPAND